MTAPHTAGIDSTLALNLQIILSKKMQPKISKTWLNEH